MSNGNPLDRQVGGGHYKDFKIQPAEYINANGLDFFQGNVVKYVSRFKNKNGIEDLEKAKHYVEMLIKFEKEKELDRIAKVIADNTEGLIKCANVSEDLKEKEKPQGSPDMTRIAWGSTIPKRF